MLFSVITKIQSLGLSNSSLLSNLRSLVCYHTILEKIPSHPINCNSKDDRNHEKLDLFTSPSPPQVNFNHSDFHPKSVLVTLDCYANDWKLALEFFDWVELNGRFRHTTETFNKLLDILGKVFEFDLSWKIIDRMVEDKSSFPDHITFRILFKRLVSAHLVNEAIDAFHKLDKYNLRDKTSFSNLIDALCEYKHVIEAEELCFQAKGNVRYFDFESESTKICNMILRGWFKMQWWKKCKEFWGAMDERGFRKDLYSYSIYMDIQCKSGKPWKAVKLYKEMKKKGLLLDVVAYNTVIRAIGISEGVDVAVRLYKEMIELNCEPNVVTFNTILKQLCKDGRYREAHKLLNVMRKKGCEPDIITYHCFFTCLEKPREILKYFNMMIENGVQPRMDTYVMLLRKFGRWGFLRLVFLVWKKMEDHGLSPDAFAYNALIDALIQKGLIKMAKSYDEEMFRKGLSPKLRAELETKSEGDLTINNF